jgi:predicted dithiol-disulfide oxidoreductase (DUF899 family)
MLTSTYHVKVTIVLDRAPKSRNETTIMDFFRRHDEYDERATPRDCCA